MIVEGFKLGEGEAERRARMVGGAIEAQIVSGYTTRKERAQAKREGSSLLPSGEQEGGGGREWQSLNGVAPGAAQTQMEKFL